MNSAAYPESIFIVIIASMAGIAGKILWDWLKNTRGFGAGEAERMIESQRRVCTGHFDAIKQALDRGDKQFEKIDSKMDIHHYDVVQKIEEQGQRITRLETLMENKP